MAKEIETLLELLVDSFADSWSEDVEELFTKLLEAQAGIRS
jgi:hypothetical protein